MNLNELSNLISQPHIVKLNTVIRQYEGEIRLVGGCVRDILLKEKIGDLDVATNLLPEQVMSILTQNHIKCIPTGIKHGTVTAVIDGIAIEITTLRRDVECDGRHAVTEFTDSWQEDASRRDFTFNALYCDMEGKIYDYFGGIGDLSQQKLNFVGNVEERIREDHLRILRAFRFHAQVGCKILDNDILNMCEKYAHKIKLLSGERIQREMLNLLKCKYAITTLAIMQNCGVLSEVMPIILSLVQCVDFHSNDPLINLSLILRCNRQQDACEVIYKKWRLSKKQYRKLRDLYNTEFCIEENNQKPYIRKLGKELYLDMLIIYNNEDRISDEELCFYQQLAVNWSIPTFPLNGNDLVKIGYKKNVKLGYYLERITNYWEENNYLPNKNNLIQHAKSLQSE